MRQVGATPKRMAPRSSRPFRRGAVAAARPIAASKCTICGDVHACRRTARRAGRRTPQAGRAQQCTARRSGSKRDRLASLRCPCAACGGAGGRLQYPFAPARSATAARRVTWRREGPFISEMQNWLRSDTLAPTAAPAAAGRGTSRASNREGRMGRIAAVYAPAAAALLAAVAARRAEAFSTQVRFSVCRSCSPSPPCTRVPVPREHGRERAGGLAHGRGLWLWLAWRLLRFVLSAKITPVPHCHMAVGHRKLSTKSCSSMEETPLRNQRDEPTPHCSAGRVHKTAVPCWSVAVENFEFSRGLTTRCG